MTDTRHWCHKGKQGPHPLVAVGGGEFVCPAHPEVTNANADPIVTGERRVTTRRRGSYYDIIVDGKVVETLHGREAMEAALAGF